jgi:hypothetical protein
MSTTTALQLTQQAMGEMGLAVPTALFASTNTDLIQIRSLLNSCGYELQRKHEWQALSSIYRFSTVTYTYTGNVTDGSTTVSAMSSTTGLTTNPTYFQIVGTGIQQDTFLTAAGGGTVTLSLAATGSATTASLTFTQVMYAFPSDFDRLIDRTDWDKSQHWEMLGPETAQQWEWLKSGFISTGPRVRFRVLGNLFQIWPAIGAEHVLGFEYVSKAWAATTGGTAQNSFTADTDTCIFSDRLMVLMLKLKYFEIKGFDTTALMRDFVAELDLAKAHDAGSPTLSMNPRVNNILIGFENIPDANYGS